MALIHGNDVIQDVSSAALNPTLRNSILPGTFEGSSDRANLQGANSRRDFQPVFPITVKDQEPGSRSKWKCLPQLLNDPQARWMPSDIEVQDAPPVVADDKKAIEYAEVDRWDRKEIHRSDSFPMIT
jgi:hypothetical protein